MTRLLTSGSLAMLLLLCAPGAERASAQTQTGEILGPTGYKARPAGRTVLSRGLRLTPRRSLSSIGPWLVVAR